MRTKNAPANSTTLKHMANNLIKKAQGKDTQRLKRKTAGGDDEFLASLVAARAFSSEVAAGSRKENAIKYKLERIYVSMKRECALL